MMSGASPALPRRAAPIPASRTRSRRRTAIARYKILDSAAESDFDNMAMLAARICGTQSAAITFIDGDRQWFKARCGIDQSETPIAVSFCAHAIQAPDIFLVKDAALDSRFAANPLVVGAPHVRLYAGMPILAGDGTPIATLCVFDPAPRAQGLTETQATTLRVLAWQVQSLLELRRSNIERQAQAAEKSAMSKELRHAADHDVLTGLPHRGVFQRRLAAAIRDADKHDMRVE